MKAYAVVDEKTGTSQVSLNRDSLTGAGEVFATLLPPGYSATSGVTTVTVMLKPVPEWVADSIT